MSDSSEKTTRPHVGTRCVSLVGPQSSGKTTLVESMLVATGALAKRGNIANGTMVSDVNPEARHRHMSTEITPVAMRSRIVSM